MASDLDNDIGPVWQPNQIYVHTMNDAIARYAIATISGVGDRTTKVLRRAGYRTIGDIYYCADVRDYEHAVEQAYSVELGNDEVPGARDKFVGRCRTLYQRIRCAKAAPLDPECFCDPITYKVMDDPVMTPHGTSYERDTIVRIINEQGTDPFTRESLSIDQLVPNRQLADAIRFYKDHFMLYANFATPLRRPVGI